MSKEIEFPDTADLECMRARYQRHLALCQSIIDALPAQQRMQRQNAGFHLDAAAVAAIGKSLNKPDVRLLEIGVWKAATLTFFLQHAGERSTAVGLDIFQFDNQLVEAQAIVDQLGLSGRARLLKCPSHLMHPALFACGGVDIVHIDGSHLFMDVCRDILMYLNFLRPGGWMIIDDYHDDEYSPEVKIAVDKLVEANILVAKNMGPKQGWINYFVQKDSRNPSQ